MRLPVISIHRGTDMMGRPDRRPSPGSGQHRPLGQERQDASRNPTPRKATSGLRGGSRRKIRDRRPDRQQVAKRPRRHQEMRSGAGPGAARRRRVPAGPCPRPGAAPAARGGSGIGHPGPEHGSWRGNCQAGFVGAGGFMLKGLASICITDPTTGGRNCEKFYPVDDQGTWPAFFRSRRPLPVKDGAIQREKPITRPDAPISQIAERPSDLAENIDGPRGGLGQHLADQDGKPAVRHAVGRHVRRSAAARASSRRPVSTSRMISTR